MKKTRAAKRKQSLRQTKNKTRHGPLPVYKRKGDKMTDRIEIENLVEDYLPGPDDNANALSYLSEQIKKRLAANEENRRKRERISAGRRLRALQENIAAATSVDENGAQQGIFERYTAPAAAGTTFEGDRGDAFDGCFDDRPAAPVSTGIESAAAGEENVFEEPGESDIIIDDNSLNLFEGGFGAPENANAEEETAAGDDGAEPYNKPEPEVSPKTVETLAGTLFENIAGFEEPEKQPAAENTGAPEKPAERIPEKAPDTPFARNEKPENLPENRENQQPQIRPAERAGTVPAEEKTPLERDFSRRENSNANQNANVNRDSNDGANTNRPPRPAKIQQPSQTVRVTMQPQNRVNPAQQTNTNQPARNENVNANVNANRPSNQPANRVPDQNANRPANQTSNRPSNQTPNQPSSQSSNQPSVQLSNRGDTAPADKPRQNVIRVKKQRKYVFPPLDLLKPADGERDSIVDNDDIYALEAERNAEKLKATLRNFGIGVRITGITRGPTVTRFEFKPDEGIKISRIVALTDDIALSLAASAVRMEAPIPGKPAIGIEIPNKTPSTVYIHDVLDSNEYKTAKSKLSVAIGKDIDGKTVITDLAKMPHLLIAGSTGSGKSVCINTMIMGILYGAAPDEVKFIMIDPKVVELGIYNNIPHLLIPVVTEPKKASAALAWAVSEVERRYRLFAENNVRDLANFNRCVKEKPEMAHLEKLPQIVIIIDELADLMMASPQDVERSIIRLAQKARAAGVHLVIATQRPSVDVITGIIKANIPSRIAFAVASQFDSRTILDTNGAEKLLGRGDMLYHPLGFTKSARLQCAFVSDEEVEKVVDFIRNSYGAPEFDDTVSDAITATVEQSQKEKGKGGGDKEQDGQEEGDGQEFKLVCDAAELALAQGTLSTSSLQRRLRLGYSRAARIIDTLEEMGLLSKSDGQRPRQVLMTREQWKKGIEEMKADE